jgi:hypothetical protein
MGEQRVSATSPVVIKAFSIFQSLIKGISKDYLIVNQS